MLPVKKKHLVAKKYRRTSSYIGDNRKASAEEEPRASRHPRNIFAASYLPVYAISAKIIGCRRRRRCWLERRNQAKKKMKIK
jgi:hypothetical protein